MVSKNSNYSKISNIAIYEVALIIWSFFNVLPCENKAPADKFCLMGLYLVKDGPQNDIILANLKLFRELALFLMRMKQVQRKL
jgi:hypothetical protein